MPQGAIYTIQSKDADFPEILRHIVPSVQQLSVIGDLSHLMSKPRLAVVGSRKVTPYGRAVTEALVRELVQAGVVIVSGLAIGVDAIAHQTALEAGGLTMAILAGGLDRLHPASHYRLAHDIMRGGALVSEYAVGIPSYKHHFIARNRLVSALSDAVLITEAAEKSGTLHTARFALEQGKDVLAVPGNITSPTSAGTNNLLKSGATPVTGAADVLHVLGVQPPPVRLLPKGDTPEEQIIIDLIASGEQDGSTLLVRSQLDVVHFNQTLTLLEITGKIRSLGGNQWNI